jgi:pantothenate synthetase
MGPDETRVGLMGNLHDGFGSSIVKKKKKKKKQWLMFCNFVNGLNLILNCS